MQTTDYFGNEAPYRYDLNNRMQESKLSKNGLDEITQFTYDNNGNMYLSSKSIVQPEAVGGAFASLGIVGEYTDSSLGETAFYTFNELNQLTGYTNLKGTQASYTYDAGGLRNSKTVNGTRTDFYTAGGNIFNESVNGVASASNLFAPGYLSRTEGENTNYYLFDGHGDVTQLTDGSGAVTKDYTYDIWGNEGGVDDNDTNPFRYCGEYYDNESGNIYLRARYYNPATSRMLSEDYYWHTGNMIYGDNPGDSPVPDIYAIMQSSNLYVYAINNPLRWIDPSGKAVTEWDRAVLPEKFVERLQWITDNWDSGTAEQQQAWREEAEQYRSMYRTKQEYTDDSGITRSTETDGEIKFCYTDIQLGTGTLYIKAGYSLDAQGTVVLAYHRQSAYIIDGGINADYHTDTQHFTTNGTYISYKVEYSLTMTYTVPIIGGEWSSTISGGEVNGRIHPGDPSLHVPPKKKF